MSVDFTLEVDGGGFAEKMQRLGAATQSYVQQALEQTAQQTTIQAKQMAPVRTGRLAQAIYAQALGAWAAKVGCNAPYALFQELGTRTIQPKLFLSRALQEAAPKLFSLINSALQHAVSEANEGT